MKVQCLDHSTCDSCSSGSEEETNCSKVDTTITNLFKETHHSSSYIKPIPGSPPKDLEKEPISRSNSPSVSDASLPIPPNISFKKINEKPLANTQPLQEPKKPKNIAAQLKKKKSPIETIVSFLKNLLITLQDSLCFCVKKIKKI